MTDRIYKGCILLKCGIYRDARSNLKILYDSEVLKRDVKNWSSNFLTLDHSNSVLDRIGFVENVRWENDAVVGDLRIVPHTTRAMDAIYLIDNGLIHDISIEAYVEDYYDKESGAMRIKSIEFTGASLVTKGACSFAKIAGVN